MTGNLRLVSGNIPVLTGNFCEPTAHHAVLTGKQGLVKHHSVA